MSESGVRPQATRWNFIGGAGAYILVVGLSFVTRTVFVQQLGLQYLGLNAVILNAVALVSVAEAGVATAGMFRLYQPLATGDVEAVSACFAVTRFYYRWAMIAMGCLGVVTTLVLLVVPVDMVASPWQTVGYFSLALGQAVISCVFAAEKILLLADQRQYVVVVIQGIALVIQSAIQVLILLETSSFVGYLVAQIGGTFFWNWSCRLWARRFFPEAYFARKVVGRERRDFGGDVRNLFPYKVGAVGLNATDSLLISLVLRTALAGLVSNYSLIVNSVNGVLMQAFNGVAAAIGIHNVSADRERRAAVFFELTLLSVWCFGWAGVCMLVLLNPFIELWLGPGYKLSQVEVTALLGSFFVTGINQVPSLYRSALGIFRRTRFVPLIAAVLNIALSIALAHVWGLAGVFLATMLARGFTFSIIDPFLVCRGSLGVSVREYFLRVLRAAAGVGLVGVLAMWLSAPVVVDSVWSFTVLLLVSAPSAAVCIAAWLSVDRAFRALLMRVVPGVRREGAQ